MVGFEEEEEGEEGGGEKVGDEVEVGEEVWMPGVIQLALDLDLGEVGEVEEGEREEMVPDLGLSMTAKYEGM